MIRRSVAAVAEHLATAVPPGARDRHVTGLTIDSRLVQPGDVYVALPGARSHGAEFGGQAAAAGALVAYWFAAGAWL